MRIIQIIDVRWYNASADFAVTQAKAMADIGHDILLLANPGSPPASKAREVGLKVSETINFANLNILRSANELVRTARAFGPDVIFAHRGESHLAAALATKKTGCPVARFRGDIRLPRRGLFSRILNERMTAGIAVSTSRLKEEYEKRYNLNGVPVRVIYPGIDCSRYESDKDKDDLKRLFGLEPETLSIGIIGRLSPVKGHSHFLRAAKRVFDRDRDVQFVIAGEDAQLTAASLAREARESGIDNIRFFGRVDNIDELTSSFDIGVVASTGSEMICRVLMEYFAAGIAVVATRINQISELMSLAGSGIPVQPGDPVSMGDAILELLRDQRKRESHAAAGLSWVRKCGSLERFAADTEDFLQEVVNGQAVGNTV
jgi:glycosyltransferase involved in cell wall biosynthesis